MVFEMDLISVMKIINSHTTSNKHLEIYFTELHNLFQNMWLQWTD